MNIRETKGRELRRVDSERVADIRDASELRAVVVTLVAIALFLYVIRVILLPFVLAGIIAYVATPLVDRLAGRTRLPRPLVGVLLFALLVGLAAALATFAGRHLAAEAASTAGDLKGTLEHVLRRAAGAAGASADQPIRLFGQTLDPDQLIQAMTERARDWLGQSGNVALIAGTGLTAIMATFMTAVLLIWFLLGGRSVTAGLFWLVPPRRRDLVARIWSRLDPVLKHYFLGVVAIVIYATAAAYVGLALILNLDHAVLLAVMTGIAETLPIIGSTAVAVIAGLVALHSATGIMSIVAFAIYAVALRLSIDQVFAPLVLGRAANVHPVLIIFCLLAGAVTFGITGVILSVPVALTVKATLATLYGEDDR